MHDLYMYNDRNIFSYCQKLILLIVNKLLTLWVVIDPCRDSDIE